jgi:alpha-glucan,water dikinase
MVLKKIDGHLRRFCDFKSWQIISPKPQASGKFLQVESLHSVAYTVYKEPTVLICERVTGEEEIPDNVVAVISCTELDALAHVSVRARNNKVLLVVCFDSAEIQKLGVYKNTWVKVTMTSNGINVSQTQKVIEEVKETEARVVKVPLPLDKIVITADEFEEGRTGAKGNNCAALKRALPKHIGVPCSIALPYGTCEYVMSQEENSKINDEVQELLQKLVGKEHNTEAKNILDNIKAKIMLLTLSNENKTIVQEYLTAIGCHEDKWNLAWKAIKSVWASKYNERVYLSIVKSQISIDSVVMCVLCQEVITGEYAYVLHTKNPFTNNPDEIYGELVMGLGETLVGAFEGRAFSFIVNKNTGKFEISAFPNKSVALRGSGFIFRSDSNSEDLPGFAGAGLFDSFVMEEPREFRLTYAGDGLIANREFRNSVIGKLNEVGKIVEEFYGGEPQDIEGVISNNKVFVVQARPQV